MFILFLGINLTENARVLADEIRNSCDFFRWSLKQLTISIRSRLNNSWSILLDWRRHGSIWSLICDIGKHWGLIQSHIVIDFIVILSIKRSILLSKCLAVSIWFCIWKKNRRWLLKSTCSLIGRRKELSFILRTNRILRFILVRDRRRRMRSSVLNLSIVTSV